VALPVRAACIRRYDLAVELYGGYRGRDQAAGIAGAGEMSSGQDHDGGLRPDPALLATHYAAVVAAFASGRLTPVLGAGANLCGRPEIAGDDWIGHYPPSGHELASYLATRSNYASSTGQPPALLEVSQYVSAATGVQSLYDYLHDVFDVNFAPTPLHELLATKPGDLRARGRLRMPPLIVTTNYDDLLERALEEAGEPYDLVVYMAEGMPDHRHAGRFCHQPPGGTLTPINTPKTYAKVDPAKRTVILKIHGFIDRRDEPPADSFVITEDHYISYLTRLDLDALVPVHVLARLKNCHLLFLGYSLGDWNLRAMMYQLAADQLSADGHLSRKWWAILRDPTATEVQSWRRRGVDLFDMPLDEYVAGLRRRFDDASG
jgi:SIR2-like domain